MNQLTQVCRAEEVASLSSRGFSFVEVVYVDQVVNGEERIENIDPNNQWHPRPTTNSKPFLARVPMFVMIQEGDLALAEKQALIDDYREQLRASEENFRNATKEISVQRSYATEVAVKLERTVTALEDSAKQRETLAEKNRKLELDLSKVRTAIGDLRMKEIVG